MNKSQLKNLHGQVVRLQPPAKGGRGDERDDDWTVEVLGTDAVKLVNTRSGQSAVIGADHIYSYFTDASRTTTTNRYGFLQLHSQVVIRNSDASVEPLRPPRSPVDSGSRPRPWKAAAVVLVAVLAAFVAGYFVYSRSGDIDAPSKTEGPPPPTSVPSPTDPVDTRETPGSTLRSVREDPSRRPSPVVAAETSSEPPTQGAKADRTLFLDCRMGTMPKKPPASGRIYALVPQPLPEENGGGGLTEYFVQSGGEWNWSGAAEWGYRCELTNYTGALLVDVNMDFRYEMRRPVSVPEQPRALKQGEVTLSRAWPIGIAKIDAGTSDPYVFYLHNCCQDRFIHFKAPAIARAQMGADDVELQVQQSQYNLSQPLNPTSLYEKK
jgi:hypothetical protein